MEELHEGEDDADSGTPPPPTQNTEIDDEAICEMIRCFHASPPPKVAKPAEPVKPA